jgi:type VI secretion system secreted protein Hcp
MFPMNLLRRSGRDDVAAKGEASRTRRVRARRHPVGLEPLEGRQLLSTTTYMLIGDGTVVHGSSTFSGVPAGSFEVDSFAWGVSNPATVGSTSGSSARGRRVSAPNFTITKPLDTASTGLFSATTAGQSFSTAKIYEFTTGGNPTEFLEFDFTNVLVTSVQWSNSSSQNLPEESVTFAFQAVQIHYWTQTSDGAQGREYSASWDFRINATGSAPSSAPTAGLGASGGLARSTGLHAARRVEGSHKARPAGVDHRLATHAVSGTPSSRTHRIPAVAEGPVHGDQAAGR